jgi:elongation of very long chain fatty acids protein 4
MCIEAGVRAYSAGFSLTPCNPFNHSKPEVGFILYVFYLSKILDFMDTVFIIAEKRWSQLSFLHVYHHTSIFLFYWLNLNVGYDGDVYATVVLNGFIHTVMYTYYFVSMHTKDIWWKPALTLCQMVQFVVMNGQAIWLIYSDCKTFPPNITTAYMYYILTLLFLFGNFFVQNYIFKKKGVKRE